MALGYNRVLGDQRKPEAARPHRVALGSWPARSFDHHPGKRNETLEKLCAHAVNAGYEGMEGSAESFAAYFPGDAPSVVVQKARRIVEKSGLQIFGAPFHLLDEHMRKLGWIDAQIERMKRVQDIGGEFISYQIFLHPDYMSTGGLYREDENYLRWCADRVTELRDAAWGVGINFYLEYHVDRITEDPAACCRILQMCTCELNGDLSHLLFKGYRKGRYVETIQKHVGYTHARCAKVFGDLSALVEDPKADWANKGVTWDLFQIMKPALARGLSSRVITGESGPMYQVREPLTQDALLVPLWRAMARYADAGAQGMVMKVDEPGDLKPWG